MRAQPSLIQSRENPLVKALLKVATSARERRVTQSTILDGERLIAAFRDSGATAEAMVITQAAYGDSRIRSVFETTPARKHLLLAESLVRQVSQVVTTSGVLALIRTPERMLLPARVETGLLLDCIQDPGNLGSILRSAVAAGIRHIFLTRGSVFAWAPKVVRAGMGAHFYLSIHEGVQPAEVAIRAAGTIVTTEPRADCSLYNLDLAGPVLWVFGNEGSGLSTEAAAIATRRISIPMPGMTESLNVAASVAICLFEQLRQRSLSASVARP
jgi:TrmH family RNA methyltransferase